GLFFSLQHPDRGALGLTLVPDPLCDHDCGTWDPCRSLAATLSGSDVHALDSITGEHTARSCGFRVKKSGVIHPDLQWRGGEAMSVVGVNVGALTVKVVALQPSGVLARVVPHHGRPLEVLQ